MSQPPETRETSAPAALRPTFYVRDPWWRYAVDGLLAFALIAALSPLLLVIAVAIKAESPQGPVFYRQERVGINRRRAGPREEGEVVARRVGERRRRAAEGKPFRIWKFRTMVPDAEAVTGPVWAAEDDPRVTRVGRVLRRTRLDELPQLFNVLRGDMRLVGPRPERPYFVEKLAVGVPEYRRRLTVPPGITGLAQIERAYDEDIDDVRTKLGYDLFYIEHRRALLDAKILFKTLAVVLGRRGSR